MDIALHLLMNNNEYDALFMAHTDIIMSHSMSTHILVKPAISFKGIVPCMVISYYTKG